MFTKKKLQKKYLNRNIISFSPLATEIAMKGLLVPATDCHVFVQVLPRSKRLAAMLAWKPNTLQLQFGLLWRVPTSVMAPGAFFIRFSILYNIAQNKDIPIE